MPFVWNGVARTEAIPMATKAKSEAKMSDFDRLVATTAGDPERVRKLIAIADMILAQRNRRRGSRNRVAGR